MNVEPWFCDLHRRRISRGDCPSCEAELIAALEAEYLDDPDTREAL